MQLARFRRRQAVAAFLCALLVGPAAQGAMAAAADSMHAAAEAARRDVDPSVNCSVGEELRVPSVGPLLDAAIAARRDSYPSLNGRLAGSPSPEAAVVGIADLTSAWDAYDRNHWQVAYAAFAAAADAGVPEAARMALATERYGSLMYQQVFVVSAAQRDAWRRLGRFAWTAAASVPSARGVTQ